jgi:hypothetical protein
MSENDKVFAGSIAESYDRYLVPLIFEDFAEDNRREPQPICRNALRGVSAGFYAMAVENLLKALNEVP